MSFKSPRLTTDGVIIKDNKLLLIKRKNEPFKNKWALPGGFVEYGEKVEDSVTREVFEETGLKTKINNFFNVYSDPDRDPRGHTITLVYSLEIVGGNLKGNDDASEAKFFELDNLPELAFDHKEILDFAIKKLSLNN